MIVDPSVRKTEPDSECIRKSLDGHAHHREISIPVNLATCFHEKGIGPNSYAAVKKNDNPRISEEFDFYLQALVLEFEFELAEKTISQEKARRLRQGQKIRIIGICHYAVQ